MSDIITARRLYTPPPPLVVLRALGLGDLLCAVPALRALRAAYPDRQLLLAAPGSLAPLAALIGIDPQRPPAGPRERVVDRLLPLPAAVGGSPPDRAGADLLPRGAVAVNLHGDGPQSHRLLLAAAPSALLAFAHPDVPESAAGPLPQRPGRERRQSAAPPEHERERWCRLLRAYGIPADPDVLGLAPPPSPAGAAEPLAPGTTLLHPGAASAARRWPAERWAAVARAEHDAGRPVAIGGSGAERELARTVAARAGLPDTTVHAGTTGLAGLARLVAAAGRVICGDSGVAHLATALGTPSLVLFGPTSPAVWGPPPDRPQHVVLWHPRPRAGDPHAGSPDPALLAIEVEQVIAASARLAEPARTQAVTAAARP